MNIKPIQNDVELEVSTKARDKFEKTIGDIISGDVPMTKIDKLFHDSKLNSLISVKEELDAVIEEYCSRLKI